MKSKTTKNFQAETKELLDLMIHSVYTNKEIFLRELISNSSDAIDKLKFKSLTNVDLLENDPDFQIFIEIDEKNKLLSIEDNGIGMSYDEVIDNIGTIAKSGTKSFLALLKTQEEDQNVDLIGQFGVGFYSAFMVAEKVTLLTKAFDQEKGVKWESNGDGTYTIVEVDLEKRGTKVILQIRDEFVDKDKPEENFLNKYTIQNLIQKYSDYIRHPIKMNFSQEIQSQNNDGNITEDKNAEITIDTKIMNSMVPVWQKNKSEIAFEEYCTFYKNVFHDWNDPVQIIHTKVEGRVEYTALLFIPAKAPYDYYSRDYNNGIRLYCKNVLIMGNCQNLLPDYLKFVSGLVDSVDFSLNISREILQNNQQIKLIGKNLEKEILKHLKKMLKKDREKYEEFWYEFGKAIKGGIYMDYHNKEKLQDLLLFSSSHTQTNTTLDEYVQRMPENQKEIYYITGKDKDSVERSPQMELLLENGLEVLYFFDQIDEFLIETLSEYKDFKIKSVSRGDIDLETDNTEKAEDQTEKKANEHVELLKSIKEYLKDNVYEVKLSNRLRSSAVCLVSSDSGISLSMEQILARANQPLGRAQQILEINPNHPIFTTLKSLYAKKDTQTLKTYSELLYEQAQLVEGLNLKNPVEFANKVASLMVSAEK